MTSTHHEATPLKTVLFVSLLTAWLAGCGSATFDLAYESFEKDANPVAGIGDRFLPPEGSQPTEVKGTPESLADNAKWFRMPAGGGFFQLIRFC